MSHALSADLAQLDSLTWHVPAECRGQMIEVAYAADCGTYWQRVTNHSHAPGHPQRVTYAVAREGYEPREWAPWNAIPVMMTPGGRRSGRPWRQVSAR